MRSILGVLLICVSALSGRAQEPLTNSAIGNLVRAGISDDLILHAVMKRAGKYVITDDAILELKKAGASDKIITALIDKSSTAADTKSSTAADSEGLSNSAISKFVRAGISDDLIVHAVMKRPGKYVITDDAILELKKVGASDKIITALIDKSSTETDSSAKPSTKIDSDENISADKLVTAFVGTGWLITAHGTDYKVLQSSNVLESTGLGHKTPDFLLGAAFNTRLRPAFWKPRLNNNQLDDPHWDIFVSLKFTPGSENTINGLVLGGAMRVIPNLDLVAGLALTPQNAPSISFRQTAYLATLPSPTLDPRYAPFASKDLLLNRPQAFDGFPLLDAAGKPVYAGNPLRTQYRNGLFIGIAFPVDFKKFFRLSSKTEGEATQPATPKTKDEATQPATPKNK